MIIQVSDDSFKFFIRNIKVESLQPGVIIVLSREYQWRVIMNPVLGGIIATKT